MTQKVFVIVFPNKMKLKCVSRVTDYSGVIALKPYRMLHFYKNMTAF